MKRTGVFCCIAMLFYGCAVPYQPPGRMGEYSVSVGEKAAQTALAMVGTPYRYKGDSPAGFDCSGLVRYSYLTAGMNVPHNTGALRRQTQPVSLGNIRKGDLVFFDQSGKKYSHVGIYEGSGRFVHAPSTGKRVRIDSLNNPYWKKHFLGARRFS